MSMQHSQADSLPRGSRFLYAVLLIVAIIAAVALVVLGIIAPHYAASGWLIAFVFLGAMPIGSLELLMIHRLTGGRWGERLQGLWQAAAVTIPLLAIALIPVLIGLPVLYGWVGGSANVSPSVAQFYLNWPLYIVRSAIAFSGWSVLALVLPRLGGRPGVLLAGVGMVFQAVLMTLLSTDWILSAEPVFMSTSFGASICVMQLLAALDFAALAGPRDLDKQSISDLGGLMLAVTLGLTYIDFMAVLVIWYSNLPHKVDWFVARAFAPWKWLAILAFALGSVAPILTLLLQRVRNSRTGLRWVASSSLIGIALYVTWFLSPVYGTWTIGTAALAILCLACAFISFIGIGWPAVLFRRINTEGPRA
jgi:hypothetical protein